MLIGSVKVFVIGLAGFLLVGCGTMSAEQMAQYEKELAACTSDISYVDQGRCRWSIIRKYEKPSVYNDMAYAREMSLRGMIDRGEITPQQGYGMYTEYLAQLQYQARQDQLQRQIAVNNVVMGGLNSVGTSSNPRTTCTSQRFGSTVTTNCY